MGKNKKKAKAGSSKTKTIIAAAGATNAEELRKFAARTLIEQGYDAAQDLVGENIKMELTNNTTMNNILMGQTAAALKGRAEELEDPRIRTAGSYFFGGMVDIAAKNIADGNGMSHENLERFITEKILTNKEASEVVDQLLAEGPVKMSSANEDTVVEEEPEPINPIVTGMNEAAGGRLFGQFDDKEACEGMVAVLKNGVPNNEQLAAISKKNPIGCQADGCSEVLQDHVQLCATYDVAAGKWAIVCPGCEQLINDQNAKIKESGTEGTTPITGPTKTIEALSDAEIEELRAEFKRLGQNVDVTDEHVKHLQREADVLIAHMGEAEAVQQKLKKAVDAGIEGFDEDLVKAEEDLAHLAKQADDLDSNTAAAQEALSKAKAGLVEFSSAHEDHLDLIKTMSDNPGDPEAISEPSAKDGEKKSNDPFTDLSATDKCKCGSGRMYKNCCGRRAFCNPKNGKTRKAKNGDIRKSEWLAKQSK